MHATAFEIGQKFFELYCDRPSVRILDIGARNFNGTLRDCAPKDASYVGVDLEAGRGVDIVLDDPCLLPFEEATFDAVVSTSCFEHNQMFWLAFTEMVRVVRPGGYVYINAPSNGIYHAYPYDNWRFYPDASLALVAWAKRQGQPVELVESFVARKKVIWNDCIMVFQKPDGAAKPPEHLLCQIFGDALNIRTHESAKVRNFSELPEDLLITQSLEKTVEDLRAQVEIGRRTAAELETCRQELDATRRTVERMKASISWRLTRPVRLVMRAFRD